MRGQICGFNWNPHNVILNERLRVKAISTLMYDWAHLYVCDGLAINEFGDMMKAMHELKTTR